MYKKIQPLIFIFIIVSSGIVGSNYASGITDTTPPVITLKGANPQTIEIGTSYTELGAKVTDPDNAGLTATIDSSTVKTNVIGSYSVKYNAVDPAGNHAVQVSRIVKVVDTSAPVISLKGANPQTIEAGSIYPELGATATDPNDGSVPVSIDSSAVKPNLVGSYSVRYDAVDPAGNHAAPVIRTIKVVDTSAPVISLVGANPQTIEVGSTYTELSATATDPNDGSVQVTIDSSAVKPNVVGSYSVKYNSVDPAGNHAVKVSRIVNVVDTSAPVVSLTGANPQKIQVGSKYTELGATVSDPNDPNLKVSIDSSAVKPNVVGSYSVTYDAVDPAGNHAVQVIRTVIVDKLIPVISLKGANPQMIEVGSTYTELDASATDPNDGSVPVLIDSSAVNANVLGSYSVKYDAINSAGYHAVQVIRTVKVVDTSAPVISLAGANPQIIEVGSTYTELSATATDPNDGSVQVTIDSSTVKTNVVGSYSVKYNSVDPAGNHAVKVIRTVNVVDTSAPVVSLTGDNPQTIEAGSKYKDLGATVSDPNDPNLKVSIDSSAVKPNVVGSYSVTYDAVDPAGNHAVQVIRTVNVVDTSAPVISLKGASQQTIELGKKYTELGATVSDPNDPNLKVSIDSSAVKPNVVGSYSVTYDAVDPAGNHAVQVIRTVNVVDTSISNAKITMSIETSSDSPVPGATYTISPNPKTGSGSLTITDGNADDEDGLANGAIEISHVYKGKYVISQTNIPPGFFSLLKSTTTNVHSSSLNKIVKFQVSPTSTDLTQLPSQSIQSPSLSDNAFNSWTSSFSAKLVSNDNSSTIINNVEQAPQLTVAGSSNSSAINSSLISTPSILLNTSFATLTNGSTIVNTIGLGNYSLPNSSGVVAVIPTIVTNVDTTSGYIASTPPISGVIPGQEMIIIVADPLIPSFGGLKEITVQSSIIPQPVEVNNTNWFVAEVENTIPSTLTLNGINDVPVLFINIQHPFEENQTALNWSNPSNLEVPPTLTIIVSKTDSSSVLNDAEGCPVVNPYTLISDSWTAVGVAETESKSISQSQCEITIQSQHLSKFAFSLQHLSTLTSGVGLSGTGVPSSGINNHPSTSNFASAISSPSTVQPIPTGVTTTAISSNQIAVSWIATPGATTYNIYRSTSSTGPFTMVGSTATTSYTNGGLSAGTTYYYKISAANNASTPVQSLPASSTSTYTVKPVTPSSSSASSTSTYTVKPVTPTTSAPVTKPVTPTTTPVTKPVIKPTTTPVTKPVIKPTTTPVTKPVIKPTTTPVTKPVIKPTTTPITKPVIKPTTTPITKPVIKPTTTPVTKSTSKPITSKLRR